MTMTPEDPEGHPWLTADDVRRAVENVTILRALDLAMHQRRPVMAWMLRRWLDEARTAR